MAISVARVHLKVAHGALPALLPTPPKWKMLRLFPTPCPFLAAAVPKTLAKPSRADSDDRWDAHKSKSASTESSSSSSCAGRGPSHKNAPTSPQKPGRADCAERWDAHKKAASPASSSPSSSVSRASSIERGDVHKKRRQPQAEQQLDDGGNSSSTGSNDTDDTEEEEILWKPRALYAGRGFAVAAPEPSMIPMPAAFLVPVA